MAKKTYITVFPVNHDGKRYKAGEKIPMDSDDAAELVARGTLKLTANQETATSTGMAEPAIGETGKEQDPAKQLTDDPSTTSGV